MKLVTISETISPSQVDITNLFDANEGQWGDVSKSLTPNVISTTTDITAIIHSNILFINGLIEAGTTQIIINKSLGFTAKKTILDIYEQVNGVFEKSTHLGLVDGQIIILPIVNNNFLIKGFLVGE